MRKKLLLINCLTILIIGMLFGMETSVQAACSHDWLVNSDWCSHWEVCTICYETQNAGIHYGGGSCDSGGTCNECGAYYGGNGHDWIDTHDWAAHWEGCQNPWCGDVRNEENHYGGGATCSRSGTCSYCGVSYYADHDYYMNYDEYDHWYECYYCNDTYGLESHNLNYNAYCSSCGEEYDACTDCTYYESIHVCDDTTAPTISSFTTSSKTYTSNQITLTGKARDTGSGIRWYAFTDSSSTPSSWTEITTTTDTITKTYKVTNAGTYYFWVRDEYYNVSKKSVTINKASMSGSIKIRGTNTATYTLTADTSGVSPTGCDFTYQWWFSTSATATSGTIISKAINETYEVSTDYIDYYIGVTVTAKKTNYNDKTYNDITDATNNETAAVKPNDIIPPEYSEFLPTGITYTNNTSLNVDVSVTVTDNSGVRSVSLNAYHTDENTIPDNPIVSSKNGTFNNSTGKYETSFTLNEIKNALNDVTNNGEGVYHFEGLATDIFDNSAWIGSGIVICDLSSPEISWDGETILYTNTTSATFDVSVTTSDNLSEIDKYLWNVYFTPKGSSSRSEIVNGALTLIGNYSVQISSGEGTYEVYCTVYDKASNNRITPAKTVVVDRVSPDAGNLLDDKIRYINLLDGNTFRVNVSGATDDFSGVEGLYITVTKTVGSNQTTVVNNVKMNQVSDVTTGNYDVLINGEGVYTISVLAKDNAGNISSIGAMNDSSAGETVIVDRTIPNIGTISLEPSLNSITATVLNAIDDTILKGYEFYIDGVLAARQESNVYTFENLDISTMYEISYKVYDIAGNITEMSPIYKKYTLANIPSDLTASKETYVTKIDVAWNKNGNADDVIYELLASKDNKIWGSPTYIGTDNVFMHSNLDTGIKMYYKARAKNQDGIYTEYTTVEEGSTLYDSFLPEISLKSITNISLDSDGAKANDTVRIVLEVFDHTFEKSLLEAEDIIFYVDGQEITLTRQEIESITTHEEGAEISILVSGLIDDGEVSFKIPAGEFVDVVGNVNEEKMINTGMIVDNTPPVVTVNKIPNEDFTEYTLEILVDDITDIESITINGEEQTVVDGKVTYTVTDNGAYEIIVLDKILNQTTILQEINLIGDGIFFETNWKVPAKGTVTIPIPASLNNNYFVVWGDGSLNEYTSEEFPTHTYLNDVEQTYTIRIKGKVNSFGYYRTAQPTTSNTYSNYVPFNEYLVEIKDWGDLNPTRLGFAFCKNLEGSIPENHNFSNLTSAENMFLNCSKLTEPIDENFLAEAINITSAKNMFMNCSNLTGSIPAGLFAQNSNITSFENTFAMCSSLDGVIPSGLFSNCSKVVSYAGTFNGCRGLDGEIPENLFSSSIIANSFRETFANCSGLVSPVADVNGVINAISIKLFINNTYAVNFYRTFYNCTGLNGIVNKDTFARIQGIKELPSDDTVNSNYRGTFEGCTGITGVELDQSVIGHEMFKNCGSLTEINLKNTIYIGNEAYHGCNKLFKILVTNNYLNEIGSDSFEYTGTNPEKLVTAINKDNELLLNYNWDGDNRTLDIEAPKGVIKILTENYPFTKVTEVDLEISLTDDTSESANCKIAIINEDKYEQLTTSVNMTHDDLPWQSYVENTIWSLTSSDRIKTVYVFFKDEYGNISGQSYNIGELKQ